MGLRGSYTNPPSGKHCAGEGGIVRGRECSKNGKFIFATIHITALFVKREGPRPSKTCCEHYSGVYCGFRRANRRLLCLAPLWPSHAYGQIDVYCVCVQKNQSNGLLGGNENHKYVVFKFLVDWQIHILSGRMFIFPIGCLSRDRQNVRSSRRAT